MLSLTDLWRAGTLDLPSAAYLAAAMRGGASMLVGAVPGGGGKTTVMCALLNWVPDGTELVAAADLATIRAAASAEASARCYIAHEVGSGPYFAYIWGEAARRFFALRRHGHIIATNLHADTLAQAQAQLVDENGVDPDDLLAVQLKLFLRVQRGRGWQVQRTVARLYESDGHQDRLIWESDRAGRFTPVEESRLVNRDEQVRYAAWLQRMDEREICRIEDVRRAIREWSAEKGGLM